MSRDTLYLKFARKYVKDFVDESSQLMKDHHEAMNCCDCEAFLQLGIDAYDWLIRADLLIRKVSYSEKVEFDPKVYEAFENLFKAWCGPCEFADKWVDSVMKRGYLPDNLKHFRKCESEVRAIVGFLSHDELTDAIRDLRDNAIAEYENGETAEFV